MNPNLIRQGGRFLILSDDSEVRITDYRLTTGRDQPGWEGAVTLASRGGWLAVDIDDTLTLRINDRDWVLKVRRKPMQRQWGQAPRYDLELSSPVYDHLDAVIDYRNDAAATTANLAAAVAGEIVLWVPGMPDWTVTARRLDVTDADHLATLTSIPAAAGGFLGSALDGTLYAAKRWPYRVDEWVEDNIVFALNAVTHITAYNDPDEDVERFNAITVRDIEVEWTVETEMNPWGTGGKLKVHAYPWLDQNEVIMEHSGPATSGPVLTPEGTVVEDIADEWVEFNAHSGSTAKPVYQITASAWQYVGLGALTHAPETTDLSAGEDGTLSAPGSGMLKLSYRTRYIQWDMTYEPATAESILFLFRPAPTAAAVTEVTATRAAGDTPGEDITDPLLSEAAAAQARAEAELDAHDERIYPVTLQVQLTPDLPNPLPGTLCQFSDRQEGVYFGIIDTIGIRPEGLADMMELGIWRKV